MSEKIRLSTADGSEVREVPAGTLCQWTYACRQRPVQIRKGPTSGRGPRTPLGVCEEHTELASWFFAPVATPWAVDVPEVGRVVVVFGATAHVAGPRAYRVYIADVIAVEAVSFPHDMALDMAAVAAVCRNAAQDITYAGQPWAAPLGRWAAAQS